MQKQVPSAPAPTRPLWVVVLSAGVIVGVAMGLRQVMGLYLQPMTTELGIGREPFSTSMAIANLIWGIGAVAAGMVADRYGAGRVVVAGTLATVAGLYVMYSATSAFDLMVSGVLLGIGVSGTGITALVGAAGRAAPPDKRTAAIASLGMAGGIGGFVAFPYTHLLMSTVGWQTSLLVLTVTMALVLPLAWPLSGKPTSSDLMDQQTLGGAIKEAFTHRSYQLLVAGFFVCGFHVAFYGVPCRFSWPTRGSTPASVWRCDPLGWPIWWDLYRGSVRPVSSRSAGGLSLHLFRPLFRVLLGLLSLADYRVLTVILLSAVLGLLWLSTVPLTSSLVATFFGTRWMSMLFRGGFPVASGRVVYRFVAGRDPLRSHQIL